MHKHHFTGLKVERLPGSEAAITGSVEESFLSECRPEAVKHLAEHAKLPGFRPGHIPEEVLVKQLGEMAILEETAEIALAHEYAHIIEEAKLSPIGRPHVSITKLALKTPLEFKIRVALEPEFKLPDYKAIAKKVMSEADETDVTEKEIEEVKAEVEKRGIKVDLKEGETLEQKIKENLTEEKQFKAKEKKRLKLVEELVKATEMEVPNILVEAELEKQLGSFKDDLKRMNATFETYLKETGKTEAAIKDEWRPQALERVKAEGIIGKIAIEEKLEPKDEELEHESQHLLSHYPDADPMRVRVYVYTLMRNQKVLEFLENQK